MTLYVKHVPGPSGSAQAAPQGTVFDPDGTFSVDAGNSHNQKAVMLTLGIFSFVFAAFLGCVWWVANRDGDGAN